MICIYLVRHPAVHENFKGICYGDSDVPLALGWELSLETLAIQLESLGQERPIEVWHSDLMRCAEPAHWLAARLAAATAPDKRLRERYFGTWQSVAWSDIPTEEVERAHDMLEQPSTFRPGGGETTDEVSQRALAWFHERLKHAISRNESKTIVAVAHSGSITTLCGTLLGLPPLQWTPYYLKPSQYLLIRSSDAKVEVEVA